MARANESTKPATRVFNSSMLAAMMAEQELADNSPVGPSTGAAAGRPVPAGETEAATGIRVAPSALHLSALPIRPGQNGHLLGRLIGNDGGRQVGSQQRRGVFTPTETPEEEMRRLASLRKSTPEYVTALMKQGAGLVALAKKGKLPEIVRQTQSARDGEMLQYFVAKIAREACAGGHWLLVRYMVQEGFRNREGVRGARMRPDDPSLAPLWAVLGASSRPAGPADRLVDLREARAGTLASARPGAGETTGGSEQHTYADVAAIGGSAGGSVGQSHSGSSTAPSGEPGAGASESKEGGDSSSASSAEASAPASAAGDEDAPDAPAGMTLGAVEGARELQARQGRELGVGAQHMQVLAEHKEARERGREGACIQVLQALKEGGWGFDVAVAETDFCTALHVAARSGMPRVCEWLLDTGGASASASDASGSTPVQLAQRALQAAAGEEDQARLRDTIRALGGAVGSGEDADAVHPANTAASAAPKGSGSSVGVAAGGSNRSVSIAASASAAAPGADGGHAETSSGGIASSIDAGKPPMAPPAAPGPRASAAALQAFIDKDDEWVKQVALAEARAGRPIHSGWVPVAEAAAAERRSAALQGAGAGAGSAVATVAASSSSGGGGGAMVPGGVGSGSSTRMLFDTSAAPPARELQGAATIDDHAAAAATAAGRGADPVATSGGFSLSVDMPPRS